MAHVTRQNIDSMMDTILSENEVYTLYVHRLVMARGTQSNIDNISEKKETMEIPDC